MYTFIKYKQGCNVYHLDFVSKLDYISTLWQRLIIDAFV